MGTYIDVKKGVSNIIEFYVCDKEESDPVDLTDGTVILVVKPSRASTEKLIEKTVTTFTFPVDGAADIPITPLDTVNLPIRSQDSFNEPYYYFLSAEPAEGDPIYFDGPFYLEPTGVSDDDPLVNVFTGYEYTRVFVNAGESITITALATDSNDDPIDIVADGWEVTFTMKKWWDYDSNVITKTLSDEEITISNVNQVDVPLLPSETEPLENHYCYSVTISKTGQRIVIDSGYFFIRRSA